MTRLRRLPTPILVVLALWLPMLLPAGAAQDMPEKIVITDDQVWTTPHATSGQLVIERNASLRVVGTEVSLNWLFVKKGGTLILESTPDASAVVSSVDPGGWGGVLEGTVSIVGNAGHLVVFDGIRGKAQGQENRLYFEDGLYDTGAVRADYLLVRNYTSGVYVNNFAVLWMNHTRFESVNGVGLLGGRGDMHVKDAVFSGPGATIFVGTEASLSLDNATLKDSRTPIVATGKGVDIRQTRVRNATTCLTVFKGEVSVDGFTCEEFSTAGIRAVRPPGPYHPTLVVRNATISSTLRGPQGTAGAFIDGVANAEIVDSSIGPIHGEGVFARGILPQFRGVRFTGVGGYDVTFVGKLNDTSFVDALQGESGVSGWLEVRESSPLQVVTAGRVPAIAAKIDIYNEGGQTPAATLRTDDSGAALATVSTLVVRPDRTEVRPAYRIVATDANDTESADLRDLHPTSDGLTIYLEKKPLSESSQSQRPVPLAGWVPLVALLAATLATLLRQGNARKEQTSGFRRQTMSPRRR